jgi:glycosyltransferase involved in cell wall biosynthesis
MMAEAATAIVAARNESSAIHETVKSLWRLPGVGRVVVMDDGSGDDTAQVAAAAGAEVLRSARGRGKGEALDAALARVDASFYLLVDADTGSSAGAAGPLLAAVVGGGADLAIGRLPPLGGGGFGLVKSMTGRLVTCACGFRVAEPLSGQRAATRQVLRACRPLARGFGVDAAITVDAVRLGYRVVEIDVEMSHRPSGRGFPGFAHRGRQGLHVLRAMIPRLVMAR